MKPMVLREVICFLGTLQTAENLPTKTNTKKIFYEKLETIKVEMTLPKNGHNIEQSPGIRKGGGNLLHTFLLQSNNPYIHNTIIHSQPYSRKKDAIEG